MGRVSDPPHLVPSGRTPALSRDEIEFLRQQRDDWHLEQRPRPIGAADQRDICGKELSDLINTFVRDSQGHGTLLDCVTVAVFPGVPSATVTVVAVFFSKSVQRTMLAFLIQDATLSLPVASSYRVLHGEHHFVPSSNLKERPPQE